MKPRFVLSPEAVDDLASIWHYIKEQSSVEMADRVESVIRERITSWRATLVQAIGVKTSLNRR